MPVGADGYAGYVEPSAPTKFLDAEDTGRTQAGIPIVLERVKDVAANATLEEIAGALPGVLVTEHFDSYELGDNDPVQSIVYYDGATVVATVTISYWPSGNVRRVAKS